jgi:hypothetical protein
MRSPCRPAAGDPSGSTCARRGRASAPAFSISYKTNDEVSKRQTIRRDGAADVLGRAAVQCLGAEAAAISPSRMARFCAAASPSPTYGSSRLDEVGQQRQQPIRLVGGDHPVDGFVGARHDRLGVHRGTLPYEPSSLAAFPRSAWRTRRSRPCAWLPPRDRRPSPRRCTCVRTPATPRATRGRRGSPRSTAPRTRSRLRTRPSHRRATGSRPGRIPRGDLVLVREELVEGPARHACPTHDVLNAHARVAACSRASATAARIRSRWLRATKLRESPWRPAEAGVGHAGSVRAYGTRGDNVHAHVPEN